MRKHADIWISVRDFSVINTVAAVDMKTTINCELFANEHTDAAHFDRSSFVGLAWRPPNEPICVEAYSTGKLNLPGAKTYQSCLDSFARLAPQLLRYTNNEQTPVNVACTSATAPGKRARAQQKRRKRNGREESDDEYSEKDERDGSDTDQDCADDAIYLEQQGNDEVELEIEADMNGLHALIGMNPLMSATDSALFAGWGCG